MISQKVKYGLLLVYAFLISMQGNAQLHEVVSSSGGYLQGNEISVSFTIGEANIKTLKGDITTLTQGFQQPQLIVTALDDFAHQAYTIQAYPNPTTDFVNLSTDIELPAESFYQIVDMHGSLISKKTVDGLTTKISVQQLVPAVYFLSIFDRDEILKTFKIIKR